MQRDRHLNQLMLQREKTVLVLIMLLWLVQLAEFLLLSRLGEQSPGPDLLLRTGLLDGGVLFAFIALLRLRLHDDLAIYYLKSVGLYLLTALLAYLSCRERTPLYMAMLLSLLPVLALCLENFSILKKRLPKEDYLPTSTLFLNSRESGVVTVLLYGLGIITLLAFKNCRLQIFQVVSLLLLLISWIPISQNLLFLVVLRRIRNNTLRRN